MKTYNIELPAEFRSGNSIPVERATITRERMTEILQDAIEAALQSQDRKDAVERLIEAVRNYMSFGCPVCSGDCFSANPPVSACPVREAQEAIDHALRIEGEGK